MLSNDLISSGKNRLRAWMSPSRFSGCLVQRSVFSGGNLGLSTACFCAPSEAHEPPLSHMAFGPSGFIVVGRAHPIMECVCSPIHSYAKWYPFGGTDLPHLVVTVKVPRQIAAQCKKLAGALGWQLADFLRVAIFLGAAFFLITADNPEAETAAGTLLGGLELLKPLRSFSFKIGGRPYAQRILGRKSALITFGLPNSICDQIAILAELWCFTERGIQQISASGLADLCEGTSISHNCVPQTLNPAQIVMLFYTHLSARISVRNLGFPALFPPLNDACLCLSSSTLEIGDFRHILTSCRIHQSLECLHGKWGFFAARPPTF